MTTLYCITSENSTSGSCLVFFDYNLPLCLGWLYLYIQLKKIDKQLDITLELNLVYDYLSIVWIYIKTLKHRINVNWCYYKRTEEALIRNIGNNMTR